MTAITGLPVGFYFLLKKDFFPKRKIKIFSLGIVESNAFIY
jgi:hypothetical protein